MKREDTEQKRALQMLEAMRKHSKNPRSDDYFFRRYVYPALILVVFLAIHYFLLDDISTIGLKLEKGFLPAMFIVSFVLFFKRAMRIQLIDKRADFIQWPDNYYRVIYLSIFSFLMALILVWCVVMVNAKCDNSSPLIVDAIVSEKRTFDIVLFDLYKVKANLKTSINDSAKSIYFKTDKDSYADLRDGQEIKIVIRQGALGYSLVEGFQINDMNK